jgi:hypothetical protein
MHRFQDKRNKKVKVLEGSLSFPFKRGDAKGRQRVVLLAKSRRSRCKDII